VQHQYYAFHDACIMWLNQVGNLFRVLQGQALHSAYFTLIPNRDSPDAPKIRMNYSRFPRAVAGPWAVTTNHRPSLLAHNFSFPVNRRLPSPSSYEMVQAFHSAHRSLPDWHHHNKTARWPSGYDKPYRICNGRNTSIRCDSLCSACNRSFREFVSGGTA